MWWQLSVTIPFFPHRRRVFLWRPRHWKHIERQFSEKESAVTINEATDLYSFASNGSPTRSDTCSIMLNYECNTLNLNLRIDSTQHAAGRKTIYQLYFFYGKNIIWDKMNLTATCASDHVPTRKVLVWFSHHSNIDRVLVMLPMAKTIVWMQSMWLLCIESMVVMNEFASIRITAVVIHHVLLSMIWNWGRDGPHVCAVIILLRWTPPMLLYRIRCSWCVAYVVEGRVNTRRYFQTGLHCCCETSRRYRAHQFCSIGMNACCHCRWVRRRWRYVLPLVSILGIMMR